MAAKPITDVKQIDPKAQYTMWDRPQGKGMIWVIDRSYSGIFFRDNWEDLQRVWRRSRIDTILVPKGTDPNKMRLGKKWEGKLPKGWTDASVKKFWSSLTSGAPKHKVTKCIERMDGKVSNPGAFCASLADREIPGWRQEAAKERAKKKASVMTPGRVYEIKGSSQDRAWWFVAQQEQKNGGMKGLFVSWSLDRRVPEKAVNKSVDSTWSRQWKEIKPSDLPKEVLGRFSAKGARLSHTRGTTMTDPLLLKVARLAKDHPDLRPTLMPILREARTRVARPIELRNADVMLQMIDPTTNTSKFYEMNVVPAGDETRAQKDKDFSRGRPLFVLQKRWGRLKDNGQPGRVDSENDMFDNEQTAIKAMRIWAGKKTGKGYKDVTRQGEYAIGLGDAGFGWGGQAACRVVPELNFLNGAVEEALSALQYTDRKIAPIAKIDSSMAKKLAAMLKVAIQDLQKVDSYLDDQLSACR